MPYARTLALCIMAAAVAQAGDTSSLARLLPPETPVFLEIRNPTLEEQKDQALYRCLEEPALKEVLERLTGEDSPITSRTLPLGPGGLIMKVEPRRGVNMTYMDPKGEQKFLVRDRFAFAWVGLVGDPMPVDAVAALLVSPDAAQVLPTIKRIAAAGSLAIRHEKRGDVDAEMARLFKPGRHRETEYAVLDLGKFKLHLTALGDLVLVTTSEARVRDCIDRYLDGGGNSLADDPRHQALLKHSVGTGTATTVLAIHVDRALDVLETTEPNAIGIARGFMSNLGLDGIKSITSVARVHDHGISSTTSLLTEGELRGVARILAGGKPAKFGALEFAPKESLYVNCGNLNLPELYKIFLEAGGAGVMSYFGPRFERNVGLRFKEDFVDLVGPEAALIVATNDGIVPDIALVLDSEDPKRLEASLIKLLEGLSWPAGTGLEKATIAGAKAHVAPLGHPRLAGFPLAPTFGVVDGRLLVTPFPYSFQRFAGVKSGRNPGLASNRDFAALRSYVPEGATGMSYLDLRRVMAFVYDSVIPLLQSMPHYEGSSPIYDLPDVSLITRHLYGRVAWRVTDERGWHWGSHAPLDMSGMLLGGLGAGAAMFAFIAEAPQPVASHPPAIVESAGPADRQAMLCSTRVRILRARIRIYRREHGGKLPDSIEALRAPHVANETFVTPGAKRPYVYLGPEGKNGLLLHGHPNGKDKAICVLMTDMSVKRISAERLAELLARKDAPTAR